MILISYNAFMSSEGQASELAARWLRTGKEVRKCTNQWSVWSSDDYYSQSEKQIKVWRTEITCLPAGQPNELADPISVCIAYHISIILARRLFIRLPGCCADQMPIMGPTKPFSEDVRHHLQVFRVNAYLFPHTDHSRRKVDAVRNPGNYQVWN